MQGLDADVRDRVVVGVRWVMILNLVTIPLSFGTNVILGRISPTTLGYYGAIQIFTGALQTLFVIGGPQVFQRFVPQIARDRVPAFVASYTALSLGIFAAFSAIILLIFPAASAWLLGRFGAPGPLIAVALSAGVIVLGFGGYFLFALMEAPRAALIQKLVIVGFFAAAVLGLGPFRDALMSNPAGYLWLAAVIVTGLPAILCIFQLLGVTGVHGAGWFVPERFWSVALLAHLAQIVSFIYQRVSPTIVLLWLDVTALGHVHAAMRYEIIVRLVPLLIASVIAPGLSKLEAAGLRDKALRQAEVAVRATILAIAPVSLGLILFSGDAIAVFGPEFREHRDLLKIIAVGFLAGPVVHIGSGLLAAFGAFRSYLTVSLVFVIVATALTLGLVPTLGTVGGALSMALAALIQQAAIGFVLRTRLGFRTPTRVTAAWFTVVTASAVTIWLDPGRLAATFLGVVFLGMFAWLGRVTVDELRSLSRKAIGRGQTS